MTKTVTDAAVDAALRHLADRATLMTLCEGPPATFSHATTQKLDGGLKLASSLLVPGVNAGDFAVSDSMTPGRRLSIAARNQITVEDTGVADHLALVDTSQEILLLVTELTEPVPLAPGATVGVRSFSTEILAPV